MRLDPSAPALELPGNPGVTPTEISTRYMSTAGSNEKCGTPVMPQAARDDDGRI
jgi:hypothetical protein